MEKIDLDKVFETSDIASVREECSSLKDCEVAEEINQVMK